MDNKMKHRCTELIKTLMIVALALAAIALVGRAQLYTQIPVVSDWLEGILDLFSEDAVQNGVENRTDLGTGVHPVCLAVCNENGRYGVHYDSETLDTVFEAKLGSLLGEALSSAGEPYIVSEEQWREALCVQGASAYYDFLGCVPLSALSGWLGGEINDSLTGEARRLLLAPGDGDTAVLYYSGGSDKLYYACSTKVETGSYLGMAVADYTPNNAVFAFQQEERYPNLDPYVMILPDPPVPVVYESFNPIDVEESLLDSFLRGLSFQPQTSAVYEAADGLVVREGKDYLRISSDGTVIFHASDSQNPRYPVAAAGDAPNEGEMAETARALVEGSLSPWCGDAGFYLIETETGQDGSMAVYFGYLLNGCAAKVREDGYAARVVITDGYISDFTLHFRAYQKTETTSAVLPEEQAVAAMNALEPAGDELQLRYLDTGGASVTACWVVQ